MRIIQEFEAQERDQFLPLLLNLLSISLEDYGWLELAGSAFGFWDNEEDAICMTSRKRGDIILVPFPFTDLMTFKMRPGSSAFSGPVEYVQ